MRDRIAKALDEVGYMKRGRISGLQKITGFSVGQISDMLSGNKPVSDKFARIVCSEFGISLNWLNTGEGEMFEHKQTWENIWGVNKNTPPKDKAPDFATVPVYDRICCGIGVTPEGNEEIGVVSVPVKYDKPHIIMVKAHGRSMEPTIKEGGYIGIDRSERNIISGELYAVCSQLEGAVVKRVMVQADSLLLISDNPSFKPTEVKDVPDYFIIGRVRIVVNEY